MPSPSRKGEPVPSRAEGLLSEEAIQALVALGCKPTTAQRAVAHAISLLGQDSPVEDLIKEALKHR